MVLRIDAHSSRELQAVLLAVRRAPKEIQAQIRKQTKAIGQPEWQAAMTKHASTQMERRVLVGTARLAASNQNVRLSSGGVGRALSGGAKPSDIYGGVEFGAAREQRNTYRARSSRGKTFTVTRRTQRQFRQVTPKGRVFHPAAADVIPRLASLWAQTTVRVFAEALEGK